jgi:hypothetical protein
MSGTRSIFPKSTVAFSGDAGVGNHRRANIGPAVSCAISARYASNTSSRNTAISRSPLGKGVGNGSTGGVIVTDDDAVTGNGGILDETGGNGSTAVVIGTDGDAGVGSHR